MIVNNYRNKHCILIDDANFFGNDKDYPKLEKEVIHALRNINANFEISINNNIIVATLPAEM